MQGLFSPHVTSNNASLKAPGNPKWSDINFFPRSGDKQPPDSGTELSVVRYPFQSFKIEDDVYFITEVNDDKPQLLKELLPDYVLQKDPNLIPNVWKVPYKITVGETVNYLNYVNLYCYGTSADDADESNNVPILHVAPEPPLARQTNNALDSTLGIKEKFWILCDYYQSSGKYVIGIDEKTVDVGLHLRWPHKGETFYSIGQNFIMKIVEKAEQADFHFAQKMQGLQGCTQEHVWHSIDNPGTWGDRGLFMKNFIETYIQRFYSDYPGSEENEPDKVIAASVSMYEKLARHWNIFHYKQLSPKITANAESLVNMFWDKFKNLQVSQRELVFFLMRDNKTNVPFAACLNVYITKMEQDRGSRNTSYKSMNSTAALNMWQIKTLGVFFTENFSYIQRELLSFQDRRFYWKTVDWMDIVRQFSFVESKFDGWQHHYGSGTGNNSARGSRQPPFLT